MLRMGAKWYGSLLLCSAVAIGCGEAKEALEAELGISQLSDEENNAIVDGAGGFGELSDKVEIALGLEITDKFDADFASTKAYDVPFLPDNLKKGADESGDNVQMLLVKKIPINTGQMQYTRLQIVNVAQINDDDQLEIAGDTFNKYIADEKVVSKNNGNQAGKYLLIKAKDAANSFAFLSGTVSLKPQSGDNKAVGGALIFTDSSPFVTESGDDGKYMVAMIKGAKGYVTGYARDGFTIVDPKTPKTTTTEIAYAGLIPDDEKAEAADKASKFDGGAGEQVGNWAEEANKAVTDFFGAWEVQTADLLFIEPKSAPPAPPPPAAADADPPPPTDEAPADPEPPADSDVVRKPDDAGDDDNVDLGCTGLRQDGTTSTLTTDGDKFVNFAGWRGLGDVRITSEQHTAIFGDPAAGDLATETRYLDVSTGYCAITTGDGLYQLDTTATQMQPKDGKSSEMWQPLMVPADAAAIQVRYAFFTQEFPAWVGTSFNDSFFVKFDESTDFIASGNLNDLAGADASGCNGKWDPDGCGEWKPIKEEADLHGELFEITSSKQATSSAAYGCNADGSSATSCYHGWIAPRVICKNLTEQEKGKTLTLRMNVTDAGDSIYDSALAVDSIVFSNKGCGDDALFSPDERSPVGDQQ